MAEFAPPRNPALLAAVDKLSQEPSDTNRADFYRALQQGVLYVVSRYPLSPDRAEIFPLTSGTPIVYLSTSAPGNKTALAAFTDLDSAKQRSPDGYPICFSAREVLKAVLDGQFDGLVVNPGGPWAGAPLEDVRYILDGVWS